MEQMNKWISSLILFILLVTSVSLYRSRVEVDMQDEDIEVLMDEIGKIEMRLDSVSNLLRLERMRYDSLCREIDSSEIRYNIIIEKYKYKKKEVEYLNADESINFLYQSLKILMGHGN